MTNSQQYKGAGGYAGCIKCGNPSHKGRNCEGKYISTDETLPPARPQSDKGDYKAMAEHLAENLERCKRLIDDGVRWAGDFCSMDAYTDAQYCRRIAADALLSYKALAKTEPTKGGV